MKDVFETRPRYPPHSPWQPLGKLGPKDPIGGFAKNSPRHPWRIKVLHLELELKEHRVPSLKDGSDVRQAWAFLARPAAGGNGNRLQHCGHDAILLARGEIREHGKRQYL